eukprot:m.146862 g.146862  ORF g.146862 m.146862 type:complete len:53 (-) comp30504_c0_seq2:65-223(-)
MTATPPTKMSVVMLTIPMFEVVDMLVMLVMNCVFTIFERLFQTLFLFVWLCL